MFTVFTDGAALLRLIQRVDTLRDGAVGHHAVHLVIWFAATPFTGRGLWGEKQGKLGLDGTAGSTFMITLHYNYGSDIQIYNLLFFFFFLFFLLQISPN